MPVPRICISGHVWTYYITFQGKENNDMVHSTLLLTLWIPVSDLSFIGYDLPFRDRQYESYLRHMGDRVQVGWYSSMGHNRVQAKVPLNISGPGNYTLTQD